MDWLIAPILILHALACGVRCCAERTRGRTQKTKTKTKKKEKKRKDTWKEDFFFFFFFFHTGPNLKPWQAGYQL